MSTFKDRIVNGAGRLGAPKPAAAAPAATTPLPKTEGAVPTFAERLSQLVTEMTEAKMDAPIVEAVKAAKTKLSEFVTGNIAVDVTYVPAADERESRGIIQQLLEFAIRCGAMGWTQEGDVQSGKVTFNFRGMPQVNEFAWQAKLCRAFRGLSVKQTAGSVPADASRQAPPAPEPAQVR
jgi:hypothetical protein